MSDPNRFSQRYVFEYLNYADYRRPWIDRLLFWRLPFWRVALAHDFTYDVSRVARFQLCVRLFPRHRRSLIAWYWQATRYFPRGLHASGCRGKS